MIEIQFKPGRLKEYQLMIEVAKRDGVFKACGSPDDPWVMLKFDTEQEAYLSAVSISKKPGH